MRLFVRFMLLLTTIMLGLMIILLSTGVFKTGLKETKNLFSNELSHISQDVFKSYGDISVQSVSLAQSLSKSIESQLAKEGLKTEELRDHPAILESILDMELLQTLISLEKAKTSGVFMILDATVNPSLENSESSRAGIFIKNMEPNIVNASFPNIRFLRGPSSISRKYGINLLPQWKMEFDISDADYYNVTLKTAVEESFLPLSRLYYWCPKTRLPDDSENAMLCCVPLIDSSGNVFGVCGFEVSEMLFKLSNSPDNSMYNRIFCTLSPIMDGYLDISKSMFAGSYLLNSSEMTEVPMSIRYDEDYFNTYEQPNVPSYAGLHTDVQLYPNDSAFAKEQWIVSLMMPKQDLTSVISANNASLVALLILLFAASVTASAIISRSYIKPVTEAINMMKSQRLSEVPKTRIAEIDDLIEFLAAQDEAELGSQSVKLTVENDTGRQYSFAMFDEFVKNIETLSFAERSVFDLYLKGHTAKEIASILFLSINTIKTHNKRIYMKLNISSRKELLLYAKMMEEANITQKHGPDKS